jgi:hypothetical protein
MEEYCVCGHVKLSHTGWENEPTGCGDVATIGFIEVYNEMCECQEFKLDNLRFVEDLAKRRNLI